MGKKLVSSVLSDERYLKFIVTYYGDWAMLAVQYFGFLPTHQQREILDSICKPSARTSISSGHGTGKSFLAAFIVMAFVMFHRNARVVIVANKIKQVKDVIWKYMKIHYQELQKRAPWLAQYFVLTETEFYERTQKGVWFVSAKGFRLNQEESLAGEHADYMLTIVDEACGVNDKAFGVLLGAQTGLDNRVMCLSQPIRQGGFFFDTHHVLSVLSGGQWDSIVLSSMDTSLVTEEWILEHLIMYGGYDSPEFQIKVLGRFPKHMSDMLLGRDEAQKAVDIEVELDEEWGWIACCDVGNGRDRSVINICKVSGEIGSNRKVVNHRILEMKPDLKPLAFARRIVAETLTGSYPNITLVVDGDGVGTAVIEKLYELTDGEDVAIQSINWGLRCFTNKQKKRFINKRALATVNARDAVLSGRMSLDNHPKTIDQASKIPCGLNEQGQWQILSKKLMKSKHQIPSPDRWDTYCFTQLAEFTPHYEEMYADFDDVEEELEEFLD